MPYTFQNSHLEPISNLARVTHAMTLDDSLRLASRKQLAEVRAALPHLAAECLVLLDDADLPTGDQLIEELERYLRGETDQ